MASTKILFGVCLIIIFSHSVLSHLQGNCTTPDERPGQCIPLRECSLLFTLMKRMIEQSDSTTKYKRDAERYLTQSQCGEEEGEGPFHPLVCCQLPRDPPDISSHPNLHLINHERCGSDSGDRVVNGNVTDLEDYRWMALLGYNEPGRGNKLFFKCGGTLINERYVLTAAHCLTDGRDPVRVRLGEYDLSKVKDCDEKENPKDEFCLEPPLDIEIEEKIMHPNFTDTRSGSDIALLRLKQKVKLTTHGINTICLPVDSKQMLLEGEGMIVTGWGATEKVQASDVLMVAEVPVMSNANCHAAYKPMRNHTIDETMLCAGDQRDSCQGDSGGPLKMSNGSRLFQYGIVSYGPKICGTEGLPGVYTRVNYYMKWILDHMY